MIQKVFHHLLKVTVKNQIEILFLFSDEFSDEFNDELNDEFNDECNHLNEFKYEFIEMNSNMIYLMYSRT